MSDLNREVGEIHTKVDHLITLVEKQSDRVSTVENQVGNIRRFHAYIVGGFTAVGTGIGSMIHKFIP